MNIGIDLDDTINNLSPVLIKYATEYNKRQEIMHDIKTDEWEFEKAFGWKDKNIKEFINTYIARVYKEAEPKEYSREVIWKLKEEGNKIIIITARNDKDVKDPYEHSENWLKKYNIPFDKIVVNSYDKAEECKNNNVEIFIDDILKNCETVKNNLKIPVYLFDSHYNKEQKSADVKRVFSWKEIYNEIRKDN